MHFQFLPFILVMEGRSKQLMVESGRLRSVAAHSGGCLLLFASF